MTELELAPRAELQTRQLSPLEQLVGAWLASLGSDDSRKAYATDMKAWLAYCRELELDPFTARRAHVDVWRLQGAGYKDPAATSLARRLAAISSFYTYGVLEDVLDRNPAAHVSRPKFDRMASSTRGLTKDEAQALLIGAALRGRRHLAAVSLMIFDGLRRGSVRSADADKVGLDKGHRVLDVVTKGGTVKRVPMHPVTSTAVDDYLDDRTTGPLLITDTGKRLAPTQLVRIVKQSARAGEIESPDELTPHSCRHAFATLSLDAGVALRDLQDALGHADPRTTMRYDRARNQLDRHPAYVLGAYLSN
jgi:site-specific recombinase XerD